MSLTLQRVVSINHFASNSLLLLRQQYAGRGGRRPSIIAWTRSQCCLHNNSAVSDDPSFDSSVILRSVHTLTIDDCNNNKIRNFRPSVQSLRLFGTTNSRLSPVLSFYHNAYYADGRQYHHYPLRPRNHVNSQQPSLSSSSSSSSSVCRRHYYDGNENDFDDVNIDRESRRKKLKKDKKRSKAPPVPPPQRSSSRRSKVKEEEEEEEEEMENDNEPSSTAAYSSDAAESNEEEEEEEKEDAKTTTLPDVKSVKQNMMRSYERFMTSLRAIRGGEPSIGLFESIQVHAYGSVTPLSSVAQVVVVSPTLVTASCFDPSLAQAVCVAIRDAFELNPTFDHGGDGGAHGGDPGTVRIPMPRPTLESRQKLAKQVHERAETARQAVRGKRRAAMDKCKQGMAGKLEGISKDDAFRTSQNLEDVTEEVIHKINMAEKDKQSSILDV